MIRCIWRQSPFDPAQRTVWDAPEGTVESLTPEQLRGFADVVVLVNGDPVTDRNAPLQSGDLVEWSFNPQFAAGAAGLQLLGFNISGSAAAAAAHAGAAAGAGALAQTGAGLAAVAAAGNFALSFALSSIVGGLLRERPPEPGEADSPTYGFSGISSNPAYSGAAMPLVCGEIPVAGPIINIWSDVLADQDEYLNMLILLAGHEVTRIGDKTEDGGPFRSIDDNLPDGLTINNEPATSYSDVEAWVRMGRVNQDPIPGFAAPVLQYSIDRELGEFEDPPSGGGEQVAGSYAYDDSEITAWGSPVGVTTEAEGDAFRLILSFPRGLHKISGANLASRSIEFQVRYRRATNGVPVGDYVILPSFTVTASTARAFSYPFGAEFIDPGSYTAPTLGEFLDLSGSSNAYASTSSVQLSTDAASESEMTIAVWVKTDALVGSGTGTQYLARQFVSNSGFGFLIDEGPAAGGGGVFTAVTLSLIIGDGSGTTTVTSDDHKQLAKLDGDEWVHLAATYKADTQDNGDSRVRFYVNGILIDQKTPSRQMAWPTTSIIIGAANGSGTNHCDGGLDELLIYERELSAIEIAGLYNGGAPQPVTSSATGIVAGWHFDTATSTTPDFVGSANATLQNSAAISGSGEAGVVYTATDGTRLADRYLIEIQRLTSEDESEFGGDVATLRSLQVISYDEYECPGQALLAVRIRASGDLTTQPAVAVPVRGAKMPVWDGLDATNPNITYKWTRNPFWILAGVATDTKLGAGQTYSISDLQLEQFYEAAEYADESIPALEDRDSSGNPVAHTIGILEIEADTAAAATGEDAKFVNGRYQVKLDNAAWPDTYPAEFPDSVLAEDAEWFFKFEGVDASGNPAWVVALEGQTLAVGHILFDPAGGAGGGGGGGSGAFEVWFHAPSDPGTNSTYTPGSGETPTLERYERRYECDIVFDRTDFPQWEGLRTIAKTARAEPMRVGGKLSVFYDAPRSPSSVLQSANMAEGSFTVTYSGIADRPNVIEGSYLDRDKGYQRVPISMRHSTVTNPAQLTALRISRETFEGMTRRTQVERHLLWKLNYYYLSRRMLKATGTPDSLVSMPGDVIAVSHDLPGWGIPGRLQLSSTVATSVFLDRPVTLESGVTYKVELRDAAANTLEIRTVTSGAGSYDAGDEITLNNGFTFLPKEDDLYQLGPTNKTHMKFMVVSLETDATTLTRTIVAIQYDAQVYDAAFGTLPSAITLLTDPGA